MVLASEKLSSQAHTCGTYFAVFDMKPRQPIVAQSWYWLQTVLGIHDILVWIWLTDPDPDLARFFSDFKDAKKLLFFYIFFL
jgi:hypothetical protein